MKTKKQSLRPILQTLVLCASIFLAACGQEDSSKISEDADRDQDVREAMKRIQLAAEHYAADHGTDKYPISIDDEFKSYFPGGQEGSVPAPVGPVNVFTGVNEFPFLGNVKDVHSVRFGPRFSIKRGTIQYCPLNSGKGYAIIGGAHDDKPMMDILNPGQVLVFSNYED